MKIPNEILQFAGNEANLAPYKMFADYWNNYRALNGVEGLEYETTRTTSEGKSVPLSFEEKDELMNAALKREILRVAGIQNISEFPIETWANHPTLKWATFAVVSAMIDMVFPQTIIESIGTFADVRTIGWGDSAAFDVKPRDLFVVSKAGRSKRTTQLYKQYAGQVTVIPELRSLTVFVSLMKVLAGKESLADFTAKVTRSFETAVTVDAYNAFTTAMDNLVSGSPLGLKAAGYTKAEFLRLAQTVSAFNGGATPVAIGTQQALGYIVPEGDKYRYMIDSDFVKMGYVRNFLGVDLMVLPQVADWESRRSSKRSTASIRIRIGRANR